MVERHLTKTKSLTRIAVLRMRPHESWFYELNVLFVDCSVSTYHPGPGADQRGENIELWAFRGWRHIRDDPV